ncbi:MAG: hypothetical protein JOZ90_00110 [Alphaproteobacteria bacterium]|nr:hypothetical protein [Alphaproteobacteria bacterium]MBV9372421.1 hypothetical protein [Alphaproteobacteria bacterium]MBV9899481.1 hypothetical protein [Alphaproteobacteria bacterium]
MARLLTFLLILALATTQGVSLANAVCRHQNLREHVLARQSPDRKVAALSLREDAAAADASKKASGSRAASTHWPAELLPARVELPAPASGERLRPPVANEAAWPSAAIPPPLKPPSL